MYYYKFDANIFEQCELKGYFLKDSVTVLNVLNTSDFTIDDIKTVEMNVKNLDATVKQIEAYKKVKDSKKFSTQDMKNLKDFIIKEQRPTNSSIRGNISENNSKQESVTKAAIQLKAASSLNSVQAAFYSTQA